MADSMKGFATKGLAVVVLLLVAYVLLKAVVGIVMGIVWTAVIVIAILGAIWALNKLL